MVNEESTCASRTSSRKIGRSTEARGLVTRRQFGAVLGGMAMVLPQVANAVSVTESDVNVMMPDGTADCYFVHPASRTARGVLVWPDIFGLRPAFRQTGKPHGWCAPDSQVYSEPQAEKAWSRLLALYRKALA